MTDGYGLRGQPNDLHGQPFDTLAHTAEQDIIQVMIEGMARHPRSHQKMIGPSEIGIPCSRRLIRKLAQHQEPERQPAWKPAVGTACHAQQEEWFGHADYQSRYLIEERVDVGTIGGQPVTGSADLFDPYLGIVTDWKFVGKTRMNLYRAKGPGQQYRVQAHLYGRGFERAGYKVRGVMIMFIPRDGELADSYPWVEEYRPDVAEWGLTRANHLYQQLVALGVDQALELYPACGDTYCPWCQQERSKATVERLKAHPFA